MAEVLLLRDHDQSIGSPLLVTDKKPLISLKSESGIGEYECNYEYESFSSDECSFEGVESPLNSPKLTLDSQMYFSSMCDDDTPLNSPKLALNSDLYSSTPSFDNDFDDIVSTDGSDDDIDYDTYGDDIIPNGAPLPPQYLQCSDTIDDSIDTSDGKTMFDGSAAVEKINAITVMQRGSPMLCFSKDTETRMKQWDYLQLSDDKQSVVLENDKKVLFNISDVWRVNVCNDDAIRQIIKIFDIPTLYKADGLKSLAFTVEFHDYSFMTFIADSYTTAYVWYRALQSLAYNHDDDIMIQTSDFLRIDTLTVFGFLSDPFNNNQYLIDTVNAQLSEITQNIDTTNDIIAKYCITGSVFDISLLSQNAALKQRLKDVSQLCNHESMSEHEMIPFREEWNCFLSDFTVISLKVSHIFELLTANLQ